MSRTNVLAQLLSISITVLLCFRCNFVESSNVTAFIIGGHPTSVSKVPYIINLRINGFFSCGGTLISHRYVITAAHCTQGVTAKDLTVVAGTSLLSRKGVRSGVARIFTPKIFNLNTMNKDISVLKLSKPLYGKNIKPIGLCNRSWKSGSLVRVSGWGIMAENASGVPNRVHTVIVPIVGKDTCIKDYKGAARLTQSMFCASVPGKRDSCSGDSGGPVVYGGRLCGIVSWGVGCAEKNYPGVYTNIRGLRKFIKYAMRQ